MREITILLDNTDTDGEANNSYNLPRLSDDEALHALSYACRIQSALSRDKIIKLYTQVSMTTSSLVDYDIKENSLPLSSATTLHLNSSTLRVVDPSLIPFSKCTLADNMTTSFPTPASDRFHSPTLSSSTKALSEPPSALIDEKDYASSVFTEHRSMQSEKDIELPSVHGKIGRVENDFDSVFQELEEIASSRQLPDVLPEPYNGTNAPDSCTRPPTGVSGCQEIQSADANENATMTSGQETPAYAYDRVEEISHNASHGFLPHPSVGNAEESSYEMGIGVVEEGAHRDSPDITEYNKHLSETSEGSPSSARDDSHSTESNMLDTATTQMPARGTAEVTDMKPTEKCSSGQTSGNCRSEHFLSKHQLAVDDTPHEIEHIDAEDPFTYDDSFMDSSVRAAVEEACRFLGNTSGGHECPSSGVTNTMSTDLKPNASASSSPPPDSDDQHTLPSKEQTEICQVSSEESSKVCRKRRHLSSSESQPSLRIRNLRARLDKSVVDETARPSEQYNDRWKGRFSHHTLLAILLPDQKDEIVRKSNQILRSDLPEFMEKHMKLWNLYGFWPSLLLHPSKLPNMPSVPKGREIWRYVQAMDAEEETHYLKVRLADIKVYLEYVEEFDRQKQAGHPVQTAKIRAMDKICGTTRQTVKAQKDKNRLSFHEHKLRGERWWWSGCHLGHGFILTCSEETGKKINSKSFKLDAFILYNLYNCRSILACCSKFDGIVDRLLANELSTDERNFPKQISKKEIQEWIRDAKVTSQAIPTIHWQAWSTNAVASKASLFLSTRSNTQF